jgi:hypothetical protein
MIRNKNKLIFLALSLLIIFSFPCSAQYSKLDSALHEAAEKRKFTYWLFKNIYKAPTRDNNAIIKGKVVNEQVDQYNRYRGRFIRNIIIKTLDPFGSDVIDTVPKKQGAINRAGNKIHIRTGKINIRNQLLFESGDRLDPLELRESERLLRKQEYIRDAKITVKPIPGRRDSVDVVVITLDRWSLNASVGSSETVTDVSITESNFGGIGHRISQSTIYNHPLGRYTTWAGSYQDPNIYNTYISGELFYQTTPDERYHGIAFGRGFYSPLTKWAGGISAVRYDKDLSVYSNSDSVFYSPPLRYYTEDVWIGRSLPLSSKEESDRSTSIILSSRIYNLHYTERPPRSLDTNFNFQRSTLYMASIGFSSRRYYKDQKIYRFGNTEDVPEGRLITLTIGFDNREAEKFIYTGVRFAAGQHLERFGYLSASTEYGTFYNQKEAQEGVVNTDITYFSDLWRLGPKWNLRQFIYFRNSNGIRRRPGEFITIDGGGMGGLYGFSSSEVRGTNKALLKFESIIYTPINIVGFQFSAVIFGGYGMVGGIDNRLIESKIYQAYGLGFLIRKENLLIETFKISMGFYPNVPEGTGSKVKFNPSVSINNLRLQDYDFSKPELVSFF